MAFVRWNGKSSAWMILLVLASSFFEKGDSVRCHKCVHYDVSSATNIVADFLLGQLRRLKETGDEVCSRADVIPTESDITECGKPSKGMKHMCGSTSGVCRAQVNDYEFNINFMERECVEVPKNDNRLVNSCEDTEVLPPQVEAFLDGTLFGLDTFDVVDVERDLTVSAKVCYDESLEEIGDDFLECASCSWNKLDADHDIVGPVLKILSIVNMEPCKMANPGDEDLVPKQICRPARSGEVAQCGTINGEISSTLWGIDFKMATLERGCLLVPRAEAISTDSCETKLPDKGPVRDLAERSLQSLNLGDLVFKGEICATGKGPYTGIFSGSVFYRCELIVVGLCILISTLFAYL